MKNVKVNKNLEIYHGGKTLVVKTKKCIKVYDKTGKLRVQIGAK